MKCMGVFRGETYTGEKQCSQRGIDQAQDPVTKEDAEDAEDQQDNQAHKQHAPILGEVVLGLPRM